MKIHPTTLNSAYLITLNIFSDNRGFFARTYCRSEFEKHELSSHFEQCSISFNHKKGTLRGMHFQKNPHAETKLVRCSRGKIFDVLIDLRPDSSTFAQWEGHILSGENRHMLYIPEGFAHGFQTLEDNTEVFYQISNSYVPSHASGVRWNDPAFSINWPLEVTVISEKDQTFPDFNPLDFARSPVTLS